MENAQHKEKKSYLLISSDYKELSLRVKRCLIDKSISRKETKAGDHM